MSEDEPDSDVIDSGHRRKGAWKGTIPVLLVVIGGIGGYVVGDAMSDPDVTEGGQAAYACALAEKVRAGHQSEDDWGDLGEDRGYTEMPAIASLLGGGVLRRNADSDRFADLDWTALSSEGPERLGRAPR